MSWLPAYRALFERLSIEQRGVIRDTARAYGKSNDTMVVRAPAGSGKTGVIVALFAYLVNEGVAKPCDLVLSTFTRKARGVMLLRLSGLTDERNVRGSSGIRVATFHSLAYMGVLRAAGVESDGSTRAGRVSPYRHLADFKHRWSQSLNLDAHPAERAKVEIPQGATEHAQLIRWLNIDKLIEAICVREIPGLPRTVPSVKKFTGAKINPKDLATFIQTVRASGMEDEIPMNVDSRREYEGFEGSELHGDAKTVKGLVYGWKLYEEAKRALGMWDFADSLAVYRKIVEAGGDTARMFVVDEAQDSTYVQRAVARGMVAVGRRNEGPSTLVLVGDPRQCIPGDQPIRTPTGLKPAREIVLGDRVIVSLGGRMSSALVLNVTRTEHQHAFEFETETGRTFQATGKHLLFSSLGKPESFYVYLMWRKGYGYRIGASQSTGDQGLHSIIVRTQQEGAERLWILAAVPDSKEAHFLEHQLSYRYQVPMAPFKPRPGTMFDTDEDAAKFFSEFAANGDRVLRDFELDFDHPAYVAKSTGRGRVVINVSLATAKGNSEVAVESQLIPPQVAVDFGFTPTKNGCLRHRKYPSTAQAAIAYAKRLHAAIPDSYIVQVLSVPESDRRVFAVHAAGVFPGMKVPEVDDEGVVQMRRVVRRSRVDVSDCYDFEVERAANFIVGSVVVHNSIYQFSGADPEQLTKQHGTADEDGGKIHAIDLRTNYRSAADIVSFANVVCEGEEWAPAPAIASAEPTREDRVVLLTGPGTDHPTEFDRGRRVIEMIQAGISAGIAPGNYCILSRTWEPLGLFEGLLRRQQIPFRMLGDGGSFYNQPIVKFLVGVLRVAHGAGEPAEINAAFANSLRYFGEYLCDPEAVFKVQASTMSAVLGWRAPQEGANPRGVALRNLAVWQRDELRRKTKFGKGGVRYGDGRVMLWKSAHENAFADYLKVLTEAGADRPLTEVFSRIKAMLLSRVEDPTARAQIDVLGSVIAGLPTGALPELLVQADGTDVRGTGDEEDPQRVTLSTIHSMKGREARVVFLLCGPTETPWSGEDSPEERRVFYVGATRAQDYLLLCSIKKDGDHGGTKSKEEGADYTEYYRSWKSLRDSG